MKLQGKNIILTYCRSNGLSVSSESTRVFARTLHKFWKTYSARAEIADTISSCVRFAKLRHFVANGPRRLTCMYRYAQSGFEFRFKHHRNNAHGPRTRKRKIREKLCSEFSLQNKERLFILYVILFLNVIHRRRSVPNFAHVKCLRGRRPRDCLKIVTISRCFFSKSFVGQ